jgi:hypothetical protein
VHLLVILCLLKVVKVVKLQKNLQRNKYIGSPSTLAVILNHQHALVSAKIPNRGGRHDHHPLVAVPAVAVAVPSPAAVAAIPLMLPGPHAAAAHGAKPDVHLGGTRRNHGA